MRWNAPYAGQGPYVHMPDEDKGTSDDEWVVASEKPPEPLKLLEPPEPPDSPLVIWSVALTAVAIYVVLGIRRSSM